MVDDIRTTAEFWNRPQDVLMRQHEAREAQADAAGLRINSNNYQVGGVHYKGDYQHWDFVREVLGNNYLLGNATKYISRWRKKNGVEDLKKALHYIAKARETLVLKEGPYLGHGGYVGPAIFRFCISAGCGLLEGQAIWHIAVAEWDSAEEAINQLLNSASSA